MLESRLKLDSLLCPQSTKVVSAMRKGNRTLSSQPGRLIFFFFLFLFLQADGTKQMWPTREV